MKFAFLTFEAMTWVRGRQLELSQLGSDSNDPATERKFALTVSPIFTRAHIEVRRIFVNAQYQCSTAFRPLLLVSVFLVMHSGGPAPYCDVICHYYRSHTYGRQRPPVRTQWGEY